KAQKGVPLLDHQTTGHEFVQNRCDLFQPYVETSTLQRPLNLRKAPDCVATFKDILGDATENELECGCHRPSINENGLISVTRNVTLIFSILPNPDCLV